MKGDLRKQIREKLGASLTVHRVERGSVTTTAIHGVVAATDAILALVRNALLSKGAVGAAVIAADPDGRGWIGETDIRAALVAALDSIGGDHG